MTKVQHTFLQSALSMVALCAAMTPQAQAVAVSGQGTWETTLQARDLDGNLANGAEAYYDTALNITWLGNAGYATIGSNIASRPMNWYAAMNVVQQYSINGVSGWRLPKFVDTGTPGCNYGTGGTDCGKGVDPASSELAHMYYVTLGNKDTVETAMPGGYTAVMTGLTNGGPFAELVAYTTNEGRSMTYANWWTGTDYPVSSHNAVYFSGTNGYQTIMDKNDTTSSIRAWAVHDGDIGTVMSVPEPSSVVLMALGLSGLGLAVARRRKVEA